MITSAGVIVGIIWVGLQYGGKQYDLGYAQGRGDTEVLRELIDLRDDEIAALHGKIKVLDERLDSSGRENDRLVRRLQSKVVLRDTIIYVNDGISLFNGQVVIFCRGIVVDSSEGYCRTQLEGNIFTGKAGGKSFWTRGYLGEQAEFEYQGKKYLMVILGIGEYNGRQGTKLAVYKNY